jgi:hypothetical protein
MKTIDPTEIVDIQRQEVVASKPGGEQTSAPDRGRPLAEAWITGLSLLVALLALIATMTGILTASGAHHRTFLSLFGETITMQGGGLYAHESVSGAAQAIGQDVVTLVVGIPLLLVTIFLVGRGSLRGKLLRAGALWYFTYTYLLMVFGAAYNPLFLVYVALFSASLFAFILSLLAIDVKRLPTQMSPHFARRTIASLMIGVGSVLALLWLGRIVPALVTGAAPAGLESYSTLFVQAGDLGMVVPLAVLTGTLLLARHPVGYLLAGVVLVKGATLGLALMAMTITMVLAGVAISPVEAVIFAAMTVICIAGTVHLLSCLPSRWARQ